MEDSRYQHDRRVDSVARAIQNVLLAVCFGIAAWCLSKVVEHGERIAIIETQDRFHNKTLEKIQTQLEKVYKKLDEIR